MTGLRSVLAFFLLLAVSLAAAGDSVLSVPHRFAEQPEVLRDSPAPARLRSEDLPHLWRHQARLPVMSEQDVRAALGPPDQWPTRIGFNRPLDPDTGGWDLGADLGWELLAEGSWLALMTVEVPGARALRAGIAIDALPRGFEFRFFGRDAERVHVLAGSDALQTIARNRAAGEDSDEAGLYWSPVIPGDLLGIELYVPAGQTPAEIEAALVEISNLVYSPYGAAADDEFQQYVGNSASCNVDVMCHLDWDASSRAVARMVFTEGSGSYLCTGTLLNDTPGTGTPYFLTAEHCISSQPAASSLNTFWFYRSTECNSGELNSGTVTHTGGADLLHAGPANDTTLLLLNDQPPGGAVYAGWTTAAPVLNETATGVHHPAGDLQKISLGSVRQFLNCTAADADGKFSCSAANSSTGEYIDALFTQGTTQGGSSGSAVFARSEPYLIGVLRGGNSSCTNPSGLNIYGRFDRAFAAGELGQWLDAVPGTFTLTVSRQGHGEGTVTSLPVGIACGSACTASFDADTTVSLIADPEEGSFFAEWGGACSGAGACDVVMSQVRSVTATFEIEPVELERGVPEGDLAGAQDSEQPFLIQVPAGATNFSITTSGGNGDVDLYVRRGSPPTLDDYDCRPWLQGNNEACSWENPEEGTYYVMLHGWNSYSGVTLLADYDPPPSCPHDDNLHLQDTVLSGTATYTACQTLTAGPALTISATANITFRAGERITLTPSFRVQTGAQFRAEPLPEPSP